ncbi:MAG: lamin tail domain-containing protein, partial [Planctomycetales bacterium]|nr:lamin tail domain-containing protein [Planctomycetales bacterium]
MTTSQTWRMGKRHQRTVSTRDVRSRRLGLETLEAKIVLDSTVVFSELMYHSHNDQTMEWVELHNEMSVNMDVSGWRIEGIGYEFPAGTVIDAGDYFVVAKDPVALALATGVDAAGPYSGQLANDGETLRLVNNSGRIMDEIDYEDGGLWPEGADGSG